MNDDHQHLISTKEAAKRLGITPLTVRQMIARGELKATRVGSSGRIIRIDPDDLRAACHPINATGA